MGYHLREALFLNDIQSMWMISGGMTSIEHYLGQKEKAGIAYGGQTSLTTGTICKNK